MALRVCEVCGVDADKRCRYCDDCREAIRTARYARRQRELKLGKSGKKYRRRFNIRRGQKTDAELDEFCRRHPFRQRHYEDDFYKIWKDLVIIHKYLYGPVACFPLDLLIVHNA